MKTAANICNIFLKESNIFKKLIQFLKTQNLEKSHSKAQELSNKGFKESSRYSGYRTSNDGDLVDPQNLEEYYLNYTSLISSFCLIMNEFNQEKKLLTDNGNHLSWCIKFRKLILLCF